MSAQDIETIELIAQAQRGDREAVNRLCTAYRGMLRSYIYRLTLDSHLTEDVLQEALMEMYRFIIHLEDADKFWPWLRRIAHNKMYLYLNRERNHKTLESDLLSRTIAESDSCEGWTQMANDERKQIVMSAMHQLKPRHREVLVMRCFENMEYSEIARDMGTSEFGVRMLFCRAKQNLARQLARRGFKKSQLIGALVLFGQLTAPSSSEAAAVTISASQMSAGVAAGTLSAVTGSGSAAALTAAGILAAATIIPPAVHSSNNTEAAASIQSGALIPFEHPADTSARTETWYYYPFGTNGPVVTRVNYAYQDGRSFECRSLENLDAIYQYSPDQNKIHLTNYHRVNPHAVTILPTDGLSLREQLYRHNPDLPEMPSVRQNAPGLLIIVRRDREDKLTDYFVTRHPNLLSEEYSRYVFSNTISVEDTRDAIHQQGWCGFQVTGQINGTPLEGYGQLPLVFAAYREHPPTFDIKCGHIDISSREDKSIIYSDGGGMVYSSALLAGLPRPWCGLHTLDVIRRDAAEKGLAFHTECAPNGVTYVTIYKENVRLKYTIDIKRDLVERIDFLRGETDTVGYMDFEYTLNRPAISGGHLTAGHAGGGFVKTSAHAPDISWLFDLAR